MTKWRLLRTGHSTGAENMATDEAILFHHAEGKVPPTLRLYGWSPPMISIGYFQSLADEVDVEVCKKLGVEVIRRITGGGAVYHKDEVTYSVVASETNPLIPKNILESYKLICGGLIEGLAKLGVEATFAPLNDIVSGGKKISGNAQTRRKGCVLQHGTLLTSVDVSEMFSLLKVPDEKLRSKLIQAASERVVGLDQLIDDGNNFEKVVEALEKGFAEALGVELEPGELTDSEKEMAKKLEREKYSRKEWNGKR